MRWPSTRTRCDPVRVTTIILGYWPIRSLCQPIRLLLEYAGASYEERHHVTGPPPTYDKSEWLTARDQLGLDFPNLPYLIDGELRLTESAAILRYLDRKFDLVSADPHTAARADMVAGVAGDLFRWYMALCYSPDYAQRTDSYIRERLTRRLRELERFVGQLGDAGWIAGPGPSGVDFLVYEVMDQHRALVPAVLDPYPAVAAFCARIERLPAIAAYLRSPRFLRPINNRMAAFGA